MDGTVTLTSGRLVAVVLATLLVGAGSGALATVAVDAPTAPRTGPPTGTQQAGSIEAFESATDFREYARSGAVAAGGYDGHPGVAVDTTGRLLRAQDEWEASALRAQAAGEGAAAPRPDAAQATAVPGSVSTGGSAGGTLSRRASQTNVQIAGIDEPDLLKTTPDALYYATAGMVGPHPRPVRTRGEPVVDEHVARSERIHLLNATDPAAPTVASRLNVSGQLLLANDTLVVLDGQTLRGYDVADPAVPEQTWSRQLDGGVVAARLYAGHLYLITRQGVDHDNPCPVRPMERVVVPCTNIHHPSEPIPVRSTYAVTVLNPGDGSLDDTVGFVGSGGRTVVSMSTDTIYVTYPRPVDRTEMRLEFLLTEQTDRLDDQALARLREIRSYELSRQATRTELRVTIQDWLARLNATERRRAQQGLQADLRVWAQEHKRQFEQTGIAAFDIRGAESDAPTVVAGATGSVPGQPLDQFALDEHEGHLRVATTISGGFGTDSANDVYVLDEDLDIVGSVTDMGLTERIYSVRFRGDEAYVVTFRRIDPFHVLDLSDPTDPSLEGELKLPGFSSYLHPLGEDRILGIGEEDGRVKLVVFDVADPTDPTIEHSRILDARWSAVARSHHAFLLDPRHEVFFLPAGQTGRIYSYDGGLEAVSNVTVEGQARRAAYIGDYLYVFGDRSLAVVDETTWDRVHTVRLR